MRALRAVFTIIMCILMSTPTAQAQDNAPPAAGASAELIAPIVTLNEQDFFTEDGEVILFINLRGELLLSDGVIAYVDGADLYLPFEQSMFLVQFPIRVAEDNRRADGWFIREHRRFSLDASSGEVVADGRTLRFDPARLRVLDGELYAPLRLLTQWLPLDFEINLRALELQITPRERIAIDEQIIRQNRAFGSTFRAVSQFAERPTPYRLFGVPAVGVNLSGSFRSGQSDQTLGAYTLRADGDLLWSNAALVAFGDDRGITDARIRLGRRNPRGGLLGPLDATVVEFGDVAGVAAALITASSAGRGVRIARRPSGFTGALDTIVLEGPIEPGYEVELYRNDILIAAQSPSDTQYRFEDVLLIGGRNELRLEFYGPQGQRRTETEQFLAGGAQARTGQLLYDAAIAQPGATVFGIRQLNSDASDAPLSASARFDYGLNPRTALTGGAFYTPVNDGAARGYLTGGLRTTVDLVFVTVDAALDSKGGVALGAGLSYTEDRFTVTARQQAYFNDFRSNRTQTTGQRQLSYATGADVTAFSRDLVPGAFVTGSVGGDLNIFDNGDTTFGLDASLNVSARQLFFSTDLSFADLGDNGQISGSTRANVRLDEFQFRASTNYELSPVSELQNASVQIGRTVGDAYDVNLGYAHDLIADASNVSASVTKAFDAVTVGVLANHRRSNETADETAVFITLSLNTFTDQETGKTFFANNATGGRSAIAAHVFLDENQDGVRALDEPLLPDVTVRAAGQIAVTDDHGRALIVDRGSNRWIDVTLDPESLGDPAFRPAVAGYAVLPRAGVSATVDLPVVATADVEGFVRLRRGETLSPLAGITVQVVDDAGAVVASGDTAFDGLFFIDGIAVGRYALRIDPEQARRLGIDQAPERDLRLRRGDDIAIDQNFELQRFSGESS